MYSERVVYKNKGYRCDDNQEKVIRGKQKRQITIIKTSRSGEDDDDVSARRRWKSDGHRSLGEDWDWVLEFWHVTVAGRERDPYLDQASVGSAELGSSLVAG